MLSYLTIRMGRPDSPSPRAARQRPDASARPDICVITTVHGPFDVRIFHKECAVLRDAGYRVCLIAPSDQAPAVIDGITLIPLPVVRRRVVRMLVQPWRALRIALRQRARAYHLHDPELMPIAVLLRLMRRRPVIFDAHEDAETDMRSKPYLSPWVRQLAAAAVRLAERLCLPHVSAVITAHDGGADHLAGLGVCSTIIHNYVDAQDLPRVELVAGRAPCLGYVGGVTLERGIVELLTAAQMARRTHPTLRVLLIGPAPADLRSRIETEFAEVAEFCGPLAQPEAMRLLAARATIGVSTYLPLINYLYAEPTKVFEYMALGLPILCSNFPMWEGLVVATGCGISVDPTDPDAMCQGICDLLGRPQSELQAMAQRGIELSRTRFSWTAEAPRLIALYRNLGMIPRRDQVHEG